MKIAVILPAAGMGRRFQADRGGSGPSKIEMELADKPVFLRAVEPFLQRPDVGQVLLAVNPERVEAFRFRWGDVLRFQGVEVVAGGTAERWETVARALEHVGEQITHVAVHDAARPLVSPELIERVVQAAGRRGAAIPAVSINSTLKRVEPVEPEAGPEAGAEAEGQASTDRLDVILGEAGKAMAVPNTPKEQRVIETVARDRLVAVQTPQVFEVGLLRRAYAQLSEGKLDPSGITDDASLVESLGEPVYVVEGEALNLKITRPEDAELAVAILAKHEAWKQAELGRKRLFADEDEE